MLEIAPEAVDVVLHFAGDPASLAAAIKQGGALISTIMQSADAVPVEGLRFASIYANPAPATLARLAGNQAEQRTRVTVQRVYALDQATDALGDFGAGTLGKLVITVG